MEVVVTSEYSYSLLFSAFMLDVSRDNSIDEISCWLSQAWEGEHGLENKLDKLSVLTMSFIGMSPSRLYSFKLVSDLLASTGLPLEKDCIFRDIALLEALIRLKELANWARAFLSLYLLIARIIRSEEHTSELQSRQYLVCRLLLEKKKKKHNNRNKKKKKTTYTSYIQTRLHL